jgi:hypothetical protein
MKPQQTGSKSAVSYPPPSDTDPISNLIPQETLKKRRESMAGLSSRSVKTDAGQLQKSSNVEDNQLHAWKVGINTQQRQLTELLAVQELEKLHKLLEAPVGVEEAVELGIALGRTSGRASGHAPTSQSQAGESSVVDDILNSQPDIFKNM